MGVIEVDESAFLSSQQVVKAVQEILANPKAKQKLLEAQKEARPDIPVPELEVRQAMDEKVSKLTDEMKTFMAEQREARQKDEEERARGKLQAKWESGRAKLREQGYQDDGLAEVEKLMETRGIADHEDAQIIFERLHPPQEPITPASQFGNWDVLDQTKKADDDAGKRLLATRGDDDRVLNSMVNDTLAEVRGSRR